MSSIPKILAFAGSARRDSYNKKLVKIAAKGAEIAGGEVSYLDFMNLAMPLLNEDLETNQGLPTTALQFKVLLKQHDGFLISCPEHNGSITALLKNAIDWASRPEPNNANSAAECFRGKIVVLMSSSPGTLGGIQGLVHVRTILSRLGAIVLPEQRAVGNAAQAFDEQGQLRDPKQQQSILTLGARAVEIAAKLHA
jgi:chromate reductase